jgi:hypothetical protein
MYLAGLIADETKMTKNDLNSWVKNAVSQNISEYTVPWIAAESKFGFELALDWIDDKKEYIAAAGWNTLSSLVSIMPDDELDLPALQKLLTRVEKNIDSSANRVSSTMNGFVIAVGTYVAPMTDFAIIIGSKIGDVHIDVGNTACKVANAVEYINKAKTKGFLGKKKKMARC